jgi:hypothetical protein
MSSSVSSLPRPLPCDLPKQCRQQVRLVSPPPESAEPIYIPNPRKLTGGMSGAVCRTLRTMSDVLRGANNPHTALNVVQLFRLPHYHRRIKQTVCNLHDLRHTYATISLMAYMSPACVQRQLGHSSISTTVNRYCHWIPGKGSGDLEETLQGKVRKPNRKSQIIAHNKKRSKQVTETVNKNRRLVRSNLYDN